MKTTDLIIKECNRYVRKPPRFAAQILYDVVVILQLEGDEDFNRWTRQLAENRRAEGTSLIVVKIKKLKPMRSRIEQLELEQIIHTGSWVPEPGCSREEPGFAWLDSARGAVRLSQ